MPTPNARACFSSVIIGCFVGAAAFLAGNWVIGRLLA